MTIKGKATITIGDKDYEVHEVEIDCIHRDSPLNVIVRSVDLKCEFTLSEECAHLLLKSMWQPVIIDDSGAVRINSFPYNETPFSYYLEAAVGGYEDVAVHNVARQRLREIDGIVHLGASEYMAEQLLKGNVAVLNRKK